MSDKQRLTSEQVLDDYFLDLLVEPEPEEVEPQEADEPKTAADLAEDSVADADKAESQESEQAADNSTEGSDSEAPEDESSDTKSALAPPQNTVTDAEPESPAQDDQETMSAPFDFERLSESTEDSDAGYDGDIDVELNLSTPIGKIPGWVPQVQEKVEIVSAVPFAEQPESDMEGVQRLLSQLNRMQPEPKAEPESEQEPAATLESSVMTDISEALPEEADAEPAVIPQEQITRAESEPEAEPVLVEPEQAEPVYDVNHEIEHAEPEVLVEPETQAGGDEPPELWQEKQEAGSEFQALFFEVNEVTFAVPLTELGGIHQLGEVNHLLGRPPWYLGLMTNREHQLDVVDTARWVMPEKLSSDEHQENYRYIVMLGESKWGLACDKLHGTETLTEQSVRWREKAGKRPWLAGMVKDKMCALIHVNELISMLRAGLDVKSVI
ncbi:CheW domain protein [Photobacterium marinum]|uniref:CheW domain protein n=1 Tax=Photobacterium marinum TaxID=1056511 RepID=L8JC06_9GAMM|nr:chemotaxis protein CheW [Photobacterium marinum]ELR65089.1 CheW domain protein [Photobacterium marinum]